ncbi:hypothetical protein Ptr902_02924 [Pyrenophora tritici-repentis]|uniref:Uncharacterized protein n=1 Tax=Pyrenophora tritici-repentis TaxID=45151 RepID=A0A2W1HML5_9PLEO|nr:hypothetical protein A1F99_060340 [Pyrenophora tritici-repentis]KAI0584502.1 hypothetical protein Alg130_05171 [Pyrenophora tritici-repentis]KAI0610607.1 hypothetical protein TUN205_05146 [Pyrenophora tritici-repentis]KAI0627089.1 hypothetical protein TUN199_00958 [Pyrenophora tritici-repentis]KAI1514097.1 hypothetical protein Ptr86124_006727 [Pyrenophora tritici-repentis]
MPASSSIQSYFSLPRKNGDGFTPEEMQSALSTKRATAASAWTPTLDYEEADIGTLEPGPRHLTLMGRIVYFNDQAKPSKSHKAAQGCIRIMVSDDTGVLTVRLWYANTQYRLKLGQLVSLWTVHISNSSEHNSLAPNTAPLFTTMFPEGERNCHFMVHENSDDGTRFKRPYGVSESRVLPGLMTLKSFTDGGYDVEEPKLLVCVKSIGARKKYMNRNGTTSELISLGIFDDTSDGLLTLYSSMCDSASLFTPSKTVLLISNPGWRIEKIAKLTVSGNSRVDVDPNMGDAHRLRALAQRLTKKEHVNPPFPLTTAEVQEYGHATVKALYTLANVDSTARALSNKGSTDTIVGYLSVIITELNIVTPSKRNMLMSNECCGIPIFANSTSVQCRQCDKPVHLRVNPRILGPLLDETGQISPGKLILSDAAWNQLLGRTPLQLAETDVEVLRYLEQRLLFLRVTMGFALRLEGDIGRLAVWCVGS